jgi:hypothetical protein
MDYSKGISTLYRVWVYLYMNYIETKYHNDVVDAIDIIRRCRLELIDEREEVQAS